MDDEEQGLGHLIEAWSSWLGGRQAEALAHVRLGLDISPRMGLPHFNAVECLGMAVVSFSLGEQEAALRQVNAGRALGMQTRNPMLVWMADLLEAYVRLRRSEDASELVASSMTAGKKHGYRHFFVWPRTAVAAVCFKALELGVEPDYANELIETWHLAPPSEALQSDLWPWPVKVSTLGTFSVVVHGASIAFKGKVQRAPLNLLKVLIAFGGQDVAESTIVDALWPDSEGGDGEQALATTLSRLRRLVGVKFITRLGGRLSIAANECWVDCWAVERLLSSAIADSTLFERMRRLYGGPFLRGDDAPWTLHLRERLHEAMVTKLSMAAAAALAGGRIEFARQICDAGLEIDDCVEAFYYGRIQCHIADGQASLAVTTYRRCQRTLLKRLGVPPAPATTRLYLSAIGPVGE